MKFRLGFLIAIMAFCSILAACGGSQISSVPGRTGGLSPELNGGGGHLSLPTLYVAGAGAVYAYDLTASATTPPVSQAGGWYYQAGGVNASIFGIATSQSGDLVIGQNVMVNASSSPSPISQGCQLAWIPARTGPNASSVAYQTCNNGLNNVPGTGLDINYAGPAGGASPDPSAAPNDVHVLMQYAGAASPGPIGCDGTTASDTEVDKYTATGGTITPRACYTVSPDISALAGSTNGADFDDSATGGYIERRSANGTVTNTTAPGSLPPPGKIAVAASPSQGFRVVASNSGGVTTIYSFKPSGGGFTFTSALGSFNNPIGGLAVDNNGNVYVGINQPGGNTVVKVYAPGVTEATSPTRVLQKAVRRPNPAASPVAQIRGLAIAQ